MSLNRFAKPLFELVVIASVTFGIQTYFHERDSRRIINSTKRDPMEDLPDNCKEFIRLAQIKKHNNQGDR